jgi:hemerythrin-like metal-binding protein
MALIEWDDSCSVGVKLIDEQHKILFAIINKLFAAMKDGQESSLIGGILKELSDYVDFHFGEEERYFNEFGYGKKDEHIVLHKIYIDKIRSFLDSFAQDDKFVSFKVLDFLEDWILGHIKIEDKKYSECFNQHGLE